MKGGQHTWSNCFGFGYTTFFQPAREMSLGLSRGRTSQGGLSGFEPMQSHDVQVRGVRLVQGLPDGLQRVGLQVGFDELQDVFLAAPLFPLISMLRARFTLWIGKNMW